jgi:hypothetical protein
MNAVFEPLEHVTKSEIRRIFLNAETELNPSREAIASSAAAGWSFGFPPEVVAGKGLLT